METDKFSFIAPATPRYDALRALGLAVMWIRKAKGKPNPDDFPKGVSDYERALEDLSSDVFRALCLDPKTAQTGDLFSDD
jgi:hypothetical protein